MVNIRKIVKGEKEYYYLEHTLRLGDKFENKRIYLGNKLPKNIEKIKQDFLINIFEEKFKNKLDKIKINFIKEYSNFPKSAKIKDLETFMIKFTYDTNRIEGSTLTLKETSDLLQDQITPKNKPIKDLKEAEAHKLVFKEMLNENKELNLKLILDWHKLLLNNIDIEIAGNIRKHAVAIARSKVELLSPVELEFLLEEFFNWYKKYKNKVHPVILAALVHLKFVTIHPFSDGNGRISRLMMNFILKKHDFPMLNIEYTNRNSYYNALEKSQLNNKEQHFIQYIIRRYLKEYNKYF